MNIDEKLTELSKSIQKLSENDYEKIQKEVQEEINQGMLDELLDYENKKQTSFTKITKNIENEYNKKIYRYEIECKKQIIEEEKRILNNLKKEAIENLINYTNNNNYISFLIKSINEGLLVFEQKQGTTIGLTKKDIEKFQNVINEKFNLKIKQIDDKYIGGCILENELQGLYIDNTILNSVSEKIEI